MFSPNGQSSSLKCLIKFNLESFILLALVPIICFFGHCLGCLSTRLPTAKIKNQAAPGSINGWLGILGSGGQCLCNQYRTNKLDGLFIKFIQISIFRCLVPKPFLQGGKENTCKSHRIKCQYLGSLSQFSPLQMLVWGLCHVNCLRRARQLSEQESWWLWSKHLLLGSVIFCDLFRSNFIQDSRGSFCLVAPQPMSYKGSNGMIQVHRVFFWAFWFQTTPFCSN